MADQKPYVRGDVKVLLELLKQAGAAPINEVSLEEARAAYQGLHDLADKPAHDIAVVRDLLCPGPAGDIPLRLYDTKSDRDAGPVIVFFHGGGFVIGDLDTHHSLCTEIAVKMDMPLVAVDYRRAPENPFPAAVDDCEAAARWVAANPETLDRAATGLILIGDSAGGNATIVTMQALRDRSADCRVLLQVPLFPLASDAVGSASMDEFADGFILTKTAVEFFDQAYNPTRGDPRAFPILADHAGSAPAVVVTASLDPIRDSGRDYVAALEKAGIEHVHLEMEGMTHSFSNLRQAVPSAQADLDTVFEAMKAQLAK